MCYTSGICVLCMVTFCDLISLPWTELNIQHLLNQCLALYFRGIRSKFWPKTDNFEVSTARNLKAPILRFDLILTWHVTSFGKFRGCFRIVSSRAFERRVARLSAAIRSRVMTWERLTPPPPLSKSRVAKNPSKWRLTRALEGGGGKNGQPSGFSRIAEKRLRAARPFFQYLLTIEFDTLCINFSPRSPKAMSPGQVKVKNGFLTLRLRSGHTRYPIGFKPSAFHKVIDIYNLYISDFLYLSPEVRSISWSHHYVNGQKINLFLLNDYASESPKSFIIMSY